MPELHLVGGFSRKLVEQIYQLADPRGPGGMPEPTQASGRVRRQAPLYGDVPVQDKPGRFSPLHEAGGLQRDQAGDGEAIVDLRDPDLLLLKSLTIVCIL